MERILHISGYLHKQTEKVNGHVQTTFLKIGNKCDKYMDNATPSRKYICEVLLRVPLLFIIHQWLLVSPYSNYWVIELCLLVVRYGGVLILAGMWAFNSGVLLIVYAMLFLDMSIAWIRQISYWSFQDEAYGICHEKNVLVWPDVTGRWWTPALFSIALQFIYFYYRCGTFTYRQNNVDYTWIYKTFCVTLIPDMCSMVGIFPAFMSELSYWIQTALFVIVCRFEFRLAFDIDTHVDKDKLTILRFNSFQADDEKTRSEYLARIKGIEHRIAKKQEGTNFVDRYPGKWFLRDTFFVFGIPYFVIAICVEIVIYQRPVASMFALYSTLELTSSWCTSQVIVLLLTFCLGVVSNFCVAINNFFLTTEINLIEAFDANIGVIVQVSTFIAFTEANILLADYIEKIEAVKMVAFLSLHAIIFQTLDALEVKILHAINSGESQGIQFYMRFAILTGLMITGPSLSTYIVAKHLTINHWLLFFASGNCTLIIRTLFLLTECSLIGLSWRTSQRQLEDLLHYSRVSKSFFLISSNTVLCYCRFMCPFFKGWWFLRLVLAVFSMLSVAFILVMAEVTRYRNRNNMLSLLDKLPDVSYKTENIDEEGSRECAICLTGITEGKVLSCTHVFHKDCLRRWFQVKVVCPFCNTDIK